MTKEEFENLDDGRYKFVTYTNRTVYGIPCLSLRNSDSCFLIPFNRIKEFNSESTDEIEFEKRGILVRINPEIIDSYEKLKQ